MGGAERRHRLMKILCKRRHETVRNLSGELNVSMRTIERDIVALSATEPIYTQCGKHGGGVFVADNYSLYRMYMDEEEIYVLKKIIHHSESNKLFLTHGELYILSSIILKYSKPKTQKTR